MSTEGILSTCVDVYQHFRQVMGGQPRRYRPRIAEREGGTAFQSGRDPHSVGSVLDGLSTDLGWQSALAEAEALTAWPDIVGASTAAFTTPVGVEDGVLEVRCESTAWATQLRLMRAQILSRLQDSYPSAGIVAVHFKGPNAPSWKKGPKSVPGRGPRDTYG